MRMRRMISTVTKRFWTRVFAERRILIHGTTSTRQFCVPRWFPAASLAAAGVGLTAAAHFTAGYLEIDRGLRDLQVEVAVKRAQVDLAENSREDLREHLA